MSLQRHHDTCRVISQCVIQVPTPCRLELASCLGPETDSGIVYANGASPICLLLLKLRWLGHGLPPPPPWPPPRETNERTVHLVPCRLSQAIHMAHTAHTQNTAHSARQDMMSPPLSRTMQLLHYYCTAENGGCSGLYHGYQTQRCLATVASSALPQL